MKKLLILSIIALGQLLLPYYAFAESLRFDFGDDGTFETRWYLDPTINETVEVAIWFDGYTATTDLLGIQCRFTYDESKVQVNESGSYCYDLGHGGPWLLSYLDNLGDGSYEISVLTIGCVPVYEGKIKIAVLELQCIAEDYAGSQIVANPWWGDGIKDCNNDDVYPVYDTLAIIFQFSEIDDDGIPDEEDNCPGVFNPDQTDTDGDCIGDVCDELPDIYDPSQPDSDSDGIGDACDTCPLHPNSAQLGICLWAYTGTTCLSDDECGYAGFCSMDQADDINCDCPSNFDCDYDVDGSDAAKFKADFGRSQFEIPCTNEDPCNGDFECDGDVDGTNAAKFKERYGTVPLPPYGYCLSCVDEVYQYSCSY